MRRAPSPDESGVTLVEAIVTTGLFVMVFAMVLGSVIGVVRKVSDTSRRGQDLGEARVAVDAASKDLRAAVRLTQSESPFVGVPSATDVEFNANLNPNRNAGPVRIRLRVDGSRLLEDLTLPVAGAVPGTWTYPSAPRSRVLTDRLVPGTVFRYYCDESAPENQCDFSDVTSNAIRAVSVDVRIGAANGGIPPTQLTQRVRIVNAHYRPPKT